MKNFKSQFLLIFLLILIFEVISYGFYKFNLLEISHKPKFYLLDNQVPNDEWWTEDNIWGAWHIKNGKTRQKRSCYDVVYSSNEVGARDNSFLKNSLNDIILIGDSFAEGYGVNLSNTSQKFIEDLTGFNGCAQMKRYESSLKTADFTIAFANDRKTGRAKQVL